MTDTLSTGRTIYLRFIKSALVVCSLAVVAAVPFYFIDSRYDARREAASVAEECRTFRIVFDGAPPISAEAQAIQDSERCVDARRYWQLVLKEKPEVYDAWKALLAFAGVGVASLLVMGWVSWLLTGRAYR